LLLAGEEEKAAAVFDELKAINTYLEPLLDATVEEGKCRLLLAKKEYKGAARSARNLAGVLREFDGRTLLPTAMLLHGQALLGSGQLDQAGKLLALARAEAEGMELSWPMWQILTTAADLATAMGEPDTADRDRQQAQQIFTIITGRVPSPELREAFISHPHWAG